MMPKIYLAGPDVFHPKQEHIFAERIRVCRDYGISPLIPMDDSVKTPEDIYESNISLLQSSDAVIANITPFRGPHCDVGTAFELGYAIARSKPVWAFSDSCEPLICRVSPDNPVAKFDATGMFIENFGLVENLMIVEALFDKIVHLNFERAVDAVSVYFNKHKQ
jgi:nucleoside 2-deoxyribosyltransferase